jgi:hypothetical protein
LQAAEREEASMNTPKKKRKRAREKHAKKTAAAGGSSGPVDRDVDESPDAVEARREAQSGPGATGVPHTGAAALDHPSPIELVNDAVDDETAKRAGSAARAARDRDEGEGVADEVSEDPPDLREPEHDKIDPHTRHER